MARNSFASALVAAGGVAALVWVCRWIAVSEPDPWERYYRRYHRRIDQRWAIPIAMSVDVTYTSVGLATGADTAFWIAAAIAVGLQTALIATTLVAVRLGRRKDADV